MTITVLDNMEYGSDAAARAGYVSSAAYTISGANDETVTFYNRIIQLGATVISLDSIDAAIAHAKSNSYMDYVVSWAAADFAFMNSGSEKVSYLYDLTSNKYDAVQSTGSYQPTWVDNILNGLPIIRFSGSGVWMLMSIGTVLTSDHSVIYVAVRRGSGSNDGYSPDFGYAASTDRGAVHYIKSNLTGASYPCYNSGNYDGAGSYSVGTPFVGALVKPYSGSWYFYKNGSQEGTSSGTNPGGETGLHFAAQASPARQSQIDIAECIVLNTAANSTIRQAIESYLNDKWGVY